MAIWLQFIRVMLPAGRVARISVFLLPVVAIVTMLAILNLDRAAVDFMSGLQDPPEGTIHDEAYVWLQIIGILSVFFVFPALLCAYIGSWIYHVRTRSRNASPV
jgi:hypothetical protein